MPTIESYKPVSSLNSNERLTIKSFQTSDAMHRFLNTGDNALRWRESNKNLKPGTYVFAGGRWHNIKTIDPLTLAHL